MTYKDYSLTEEEFNKLVDAINEARNTPLIMLQCGRPSTPQEVANDHWVQLGIKYGFKWMTAKPNGDDPLCFKAIPLTEEELATLTR